MSACHYKAKSLCFNKNSIWTTMSLHSNNLPLNQFTFHYCLAMGGNCAKQKRYKRPPSSESEDSEDSESSRSNTRGSKTSRKRSSKRSSRTTTSNTRPRTPTKAITAIKQKVNIGNDQFYRKLNPKNPEFGKTPAGASHSSRSNCEKSTASSAYSKMYINGK